MSFDLDQAAQAVLTLLRAGNTPSSRLDVFDGQPSAVMDSDGRAHPYAACYFGPGRHDPDEYTLCGDPTLRRWTFQITAAGGDETRARRAITRVRAALEDAPLTVGDSQTRIRLEADPGYPRTDNSVTPARVYLPLLFAVDL